MVDELEQVKSPEKDRVDVEEVAPRHPTLLAPRGTLSKWDPIAVDAHSPYPDS